MSLSAGRNTKQYGVGKAVADDIGVKQAGSTKIYEGALVALNAGGYLVPGSASTTLTAAGVAKMNPNVGNVSDTTGLADGAVAIRISQGIFKFYNSTSADLIAQAQVGQYCYIVDDQTVAKTNGGSTRSIAGIIIGVDSDGNVDVAIGLQFTPSASVAALQAQINAVINGNTEEVSASGPLSIVKRTTRLTVGGTLALTLADGTVAGQRKTIYAAANSGTPAATLTPAHASGFTTVLFGAACAQSSIELEWDSSLGTPAWKLVGVVKASGATITIS